MATLRLVDRIRKARTLRAAHHNGSTCDACKVPLRENTTGFRRVGDRCLCSDCYFREFSDEIEKAGGVFRPTMRGTGSRG